MAQTRHQDYTLASVKLSDSHKVIDLKVRYEKGGHSWFHGGVTGSGVYLGASLVEKSGGFTSMSIGGDKHLKTILAEAGRYNQKQLITIAQDLIVNGEKSLLYGEAYAGLIKAMAERNNVTIATSDEDVYKIAEFEPGQHVRQLQPGNDIRPVLWTGVIVEKRMENGTLRYTVADDDNWLKQYVKAVGHTTKLEATGEPNLTADEVLERVEACEQRAKNHADAQAAAKASDEAEVAVEVSKLKALYPWAKQIGSSYARAAANLKTELTLAFPGVEFSVKSKSYSMGDSIDVLWTDGPTKAQVDAIADKYEYQRISESDMMCDSSSAKPGALYKAAAIHLGQAKWVHVARLFSEAAQETLKSTNYHEMNRILDRSEIFSTNLIAVEGEGSEKVAMFEKPEVKQTIFPIGDKITVTENAAKGGIEIKFSERPDEAMISEVKRQGFRWSRRQCLWYAKATEQSRKYAHGLTNARPPQGNVGVIDEASPFVASTSFEDRVASLGNSL